MCLIVWQLVDLNPPKPPEKGKRADTFKTNLAGDWINHLSITIYHGCRSQSGGEQWDEPSVPGFALFFSIQAMLSRYDITDTVASSMINSFFSLLSHRRLCRSFLMGHWGHIHTWYSQTKMIKCFSSVSEVMSITMNARLACTCPSKQDADTSYVLLCSWLLSYRKYCNWGTDTGWQLQQVQL